jgi:hypothetical protein
MNTMAPAPDPDADVRALALWRGRLVRTLRAAVCGAGAMDEAMKGVAAWKRESPA